MVLCSKVYKKANPGLAVRIYLLVYNNSCEEAKYLAGVRREKESFEKLIRERGVRLLSCGMLDLHRGPDPLDYYDFLDLFNHLCFFLVDAQSYPGPTKIRGYRIIDEGCELQNRGG